MFVRKTRTTGSNMENEKNADFLIRKREYTVFIKKIIYLSDDLL